MSISSIASSPMPVSTPATKPSAAAPVNDHDADDLPGAAAAAPKAAPASGTGQVIDKVA